MAQDRISAAKERRSEGGGGGGGSGRGGGGGGGGGGGSGGDGSEVQEGRSNMSKQSQSPGVKFAHPGAMFNAKFKLEIPGPDEYVAAGWSFRTTAPTRLISSSARLYEHSHSRLSVLRSRSSSCSECPCCAGVSSIASPRDVASPRISTGARRGKRPGQGVH